MTGLKNPITIITFSLITVAFAGAETELTLSLDECVAIALEYNLSLRQEKVALQTAERIAKNAWSLLLPGLSLGTGANYTTSLAEDSLQPDGDSIEYSISAALSFQLDGSTAAEIKNLRLARGLAELTWEASSREVIASVSDSFLNLQLALSRFQLLEENLERAGKQHEKTNVRYKNGYVDKKEVLQARLEVENARLELNKGKSSLNLQKLELNNLCGLSSDTEIIPVGDFDARPIAFDEEDLVACYLNESADIRSAELQVQIAETTASINSTARLPSLQLSGKVKTSGTSSQDFLSASALTLGLSVNIPVDGWLPGSQTDLKISKAKGEVEIAEYSLAMSKATAEYEIRVLAATLVEKANEIEIAQLQLSLAEETYALVEKEYANGTSEFLTLQESRKDLLSARLDLLNSQYEYMTALGELKLKLGQDNYNTFFIQENTDEQKTR